MEHFSSPADKVRISSMLPWMKTKIPYWMSKKEHELSPLLSVLALLILFYYQNDSLKWLGKKLKYLKLHEKNPITMFKNIIIIYSQPLQCSVRMPMACKAPSLSGQFTFQKPHASRAHQRCSDLCEFTVTSSPAKNTRPFYCLQPCLFFLSKSI